MSSSLCTAGPVIKCDLFKNVDGSSRVSRSSIVLASSG